MSSKLVRKLLQVTADVPSTNIGNIHEGRSSGNAPPTKKRKTAMTTTITTTADILPKEILLQRHIQSLISLDHAMSSESKSRTPSKNSRHAGLKRPATTTDTDTSMMILTNSRSSSSVLQQQPLQPTFNKRRHAQEKKKQTLEKIRKMLRKTKKAQQKGKKSK